MKVALLLCVVGVSLAATINKADLENEAIEKRNFGFQSQGQMQFGVGGRQVQSQRQVQKQAGRGRQMQKQKQVQMQASHSRQMQAQKQFQMQTSHSRQMQAQKQVQMQASHSRQMQAQKQVQ